MAEINKGWLGRLKNTFSETKNRLTSGIQQIFNTQAMSPDILESLEELLISYDFGTHTANNLIYSLKGRTLTTSEEAISYLKTKIKDILTTVERKLILEEKKLNIILICGVNGSGKTTSIAKLAYLLQNQKRKLYVAACDTFRAAATEQLKSWTDKLDIPIVYSQKAGQDPASLAYQALEQARAAQADSLIIDTSGRMHNKKDLMNELDKIIRVLKKQGIDGTFHTILVLDSTTGQNAISQLESFKQITEISGLIITKLDGDTSKAGFIVRIASEYKIPIYYIGIGEKIEDLKPFSAEEFASFLL